MREVKSTDAEGRPTELTFGNGLTQSRSYYANTGRLKESRVISGNAEVAVEGYQYDVLGNVGSRIQYAAQQGFQETFRYDGLNRLEASQVLGQAESRHEYDVLGNLISKSGVGAYSYPVPGVGVVRPHAVRSITGVGSFEYDDNGNLTSGAGRVYQWTSFDMPRKIVQAGVTSSFVYGPEHQRLRQDKNDGSVIYAGAQEVETKNGQVTVKTYWPDGIGVEIDRPGQARELNWTFVDRLGSIFAIVDESGSMRERLAYDPWGTRRLVDGSGMPSTLVGVTDNKGFTGHEMLDQLGLVHMNGRIYDPRVARFISGDPLVQDPYNSQSYNRYSYVFNNPTNLSDPSGFAACDENKGCGSNEMSQVSVVGVRSVSGISMDGASTSNSDSKAGNMPVTRITGHSGDSLRASVIAKKGGRSTNNGGSINTDPLRGSVQTFEEYGPNVAGTNLRRVKPPDYAEAEVGTLIGIAASALPLERAAVWGFEGYAFWRASRAIKPAQERVRELHQLLDPRAQRARTTAITETEEGVRVVSSSERRLSPAQRNALAKNEVEGVGGGHAEVTGINAAKEMGLKPTGTAASRPICSGCAAHIKEIGVDPLTPLK